MLSHYIEVAAEGQLELFVGSHRILPTVEQVDGIATLQQLKVVPQRQPIANDPIQPLEPARPHPRRVHDTDIPRVAQSYLGPVESLDVILRHLTRPSVGHRAADINPRIAPIPLDMLFARPLKLALRLVYSLVVHSSYGFT